MMLSDILIRDVTALDANEILEIYAPYITDTAITFEEHVPTPKEFKTRIETITTQYPYIAATVNGKIIGYAYASPLKTRDAFARSCELSIYLRRTCERQKLGTLLYKALFNRLKAQGVISVYAAIASCPQPSPWLDDTSIKFHLAQGFKHTGTFPECAAKFGMWFDLVWMYKDLAERTKKSADSRLFIPRNKSLAMI